MSTPIESVTAKPLNFRRYKDGDNKVRSFQKDIFDAGHSHKCPTYIQSTPPVPGELPGRRRHSRLPQHRSRNREAPHRTCLGRSTRFAA
jgi:hypothetical protein